MRSIATRQLMSFSCPLARRQWSRSHTTCERANRWRLGSSAMMARIRLHLLLAEQPSAVAHRLRRHGCRPPGRARRVARSRLAAVPGQEPLEVRRHPTAGVRTGPQILGQPSARVDPPPFERVEQAEQRGAQFAAPLRPRAVVVLAPHHRAAQRTLGLIVVHRQVGVLDEQRQAIPVVAQATQHLRARRRQLRLLRQFALPPLLHRLHTRP